MRDFIFRYPQERSKHLRTIKLRHANLNRIELRCYCDAIPTAAVCRPAHSQMTYGSGHFTSESQGREHVT